MAERVYVTAKSPELDQKCSNSCKQNVGFHSGSTADMILQLQRTAGNQAVQRLIKSRVLQAKLRIGQPNDIYEQEADRVAEQVMRMPDPILQRQCAAESGGGKGGTKVSAFQGERPSFSIQRQHEEERPVKIQEMKKCDMKINKQVAEGISKAREMVSLALKALKRDIPLSYEAKAMSDNFGSLDDQAKQIVISRYEDIQTTLEGKEIKCVIKCPKKSGTDLCAQAESPGKKIFICPDFGTAGCAPGPTMLHEAAHNAGAKDDVDRGEGYPPKNSYNNAYSYEYLPQDLRKGYPEVKLRSKKEISIEVP